MKNGRYEVGGSVCWYKDDLFHRLDGPAIEWTNGRKKWYLNGKLHRVGGPADIWPDGSLEWWVNGKRHRVNGPAIEWVNMDKIWYVDDKEVDVLAVFGYEPSVPLSEEEQVILRLSI